MPVKAPFADVYLNLDWLLDVLQSESLLLLLIAEPVLLGVASTSDGQGKQWSQVLFTDESRFTVSFNDGRIRVWRRPGERFTDDTIQEVDRYGRGSVMVWGGFYRRSRTPLYIIQGNLTGPRYQNEILRPIVQPALEAIGGNAILQDDNARPHRVRVVNEFIQQHGVTRMAWPARSPDLSPIEHLCDVLGRRLSTNYPLPMDVAQLTAFLLQEWQAVP